MITETDLRDALVERASDVPAAAAARLRRADYRPRPFRVRPPIAFGAAVGAAGTAAVAISVVGLGASASNAFAGWTPTPTRASSGQTNRAETAFKARIHGPLTTGLTPVLTDTRGPFTVTIFAANDRIAACFNGPSFTACNATAGPGVTSVPADQVKLSSTHLSTRAGSPYSIVEGHAGTGVSGVTLVLADGSHVTATTSNGWFAAWWPSAQNATEALLQTPSGTTTQQINNPPSPPCQGSCTNTAIKSQSSNFGSGAQHGTVTSSGRISGVAAP